MSVNHRLMRSVVLGLSWCSLAWVMTSLLPSALGQSLPASAPASRPRAQALKPVPTQPGKPAPPTQPSKAMPPAPASMNSSPRELSRDEELYLLEARQAQLALDQARNEMDKAKVELDEIYSLYQDKLVTVDKLNDARQKLEQATLKHEQARIDRQRKYLEFLKGATLVSVVDARKYRDEDNEIVASIRLRNDSNLGKARIAMESSGERLSDERLAALLKVDNVIVTLRGEAPIASAGGVSGSAEKRYSSGKAIIGDPFQQIVPELKLGAEVELKYRLVKRDVENISVAMEFLGVQKEYDVFLKKESQQDLPVVTASPPSQIGQLGSKILYELDLERLAKTEQGFSLVVLNLPEEIKASVLDTTSKAIITEVRFTEELSRQRLFLELSIPEKLSPALVNANIPFCFLVTRRTELKRVYDLRQQYEGKSVPPEEVKKLKASVVDLALTPRGVGKLEILVPNLFKEIKQGENAAVKFSILNSGTLPLRRVTPKLDLPLEWEGELSPAEAEVINGGDKTMFTANIRPPKEVGVGEYTMKMTTDGHSGVETIEAPPKDMTIRVAAVSNITGTVVLVALLVALVIGIAIASIKISRR